MTSGVEMNLSKLLHNIPGDNFGDCKDAMVTGLTCDSRQVRSGDIFFALPGVDHDGHDYISDAVSRGAGVVVAEQQIVLPAGVCGLKVENARQAMAHIAQAFYGDPTSDIPVIGVTGTNGKTTITYLLEAILEQAGLSPIVIGTVNYRFGDRQVPAPHTTPESHELLARVAEFREDGAGSLVMEASSHALDQCRADGLHYRVGVFTNLTPEHLDYHLDMEQYFASKCRLFLNLLPRDQGRSVINIDDAFGRRLADMIPDALTCGIDSRADVRPLELNVSLQGIRGQVTTPVGELQVDSALRGDYNVENLLCAIAAALALDLPLATIEQGLTNAKAVPGRLEPVENDRDALVLVDYAHTGDALRRVLEAMKKLAPRRVLTVFGCGGDRDRSKRPVMGEVAAKMSDIAIVTADNPRTEDPGQIIADIRVGLERVHKCERSREEMIKTADRGYVVIPDRREAIEFAVSLLEADDLLLVAGKGHEDYQILGTEKIHFDDREELRQAFKSGATA
jgi:UDP-N-acetylmuramoyl-L-alanyl-D-glutamate--2,6-diaminopimelate ligase